MAQPLFTISLCAREIDVSVEVYPARKDASPGSVKLSDAHNEGYQVCERASERLFDTDSRW